MQAKNQNKPAMKGNFATKPYKKPEQNGQQNGGKVQMLMKKQVKWHKQRVTDFPKNNGKTEVSRDQITQLRADALQLLKSDIWAYEQQKSSGSKSDNFEWIKNVLSNGTVNDKLAAHTVLIQDSAIHNLRSLENVMKFINPKGKRECVLAIDNLRDLFVGDLLVPKEKLSTFEDLVKQPEINWLMKPGPERNRFLIVAHFEDQLRANYKKFIDALIVVGQDSLDTMKTKSIRTLFDLLVSNGEQERMLLSSLVNKLGDPLPKIASKTAHLLSEIFSKHHKDMKLTVVKEVERLIFRPNSTDRSQYYCLCFLTEIMFQRNTETELANHMIGIYLALFNNLIKVGEVDNKMMAMILTGVSRAFPYSKLEAELLEQHLTTFYRIIHYVNLNTGIQTLALIMNIVDFRESGSLTDRFYSVLYRFCTSPQLDQCRKTNTLLNVVFQAIKKDSIIKRVRAFAKRLAQYALISYTPFTISVLILISETIKHHEGFRLEASAFGNSGQKGDKKNGIITNSNADSDDDDDKKEDKKPHFDDDEDDDGVEVYHDAPEEDEEDTKKPAPKATSGPKSSWVHINNRQGQSSKPDEEGESKPRSDAYQIEGRNPMFANAENEHFWELFTLQRHYHPTTKMFTDKLLGGSSIEYDGNPLDDFTVKRFLDRFVFRNPKTDVKNSKNQTVFSRKKKATGSDKVYSPHELMGMTETEVPVDQQYIYQYLMQRKALKLKGRHDNIDDDGSDVESVNSDEFNDALDNMENDGDIDFADNYKKNKKALKKLMRDDNDDEDEDDENDFGDDADFDEEFDLDDFSGADDDDEDIHMGGDDDDEGDDDNDDGQDFGDDDFAELDTGKGKKKSASTTQFAGKKGFSKITNDIFASAQEFSNILDGNDSDSDFEMDDKANANDVGGAVKKAKKPKLGANGKPLSAKSAQRAINKKMSLKRKRMGREGHKAGKKGGKRSKVDL